MPELPDVELYLHALRARVLNRRLEAIRIGSPFVLRTFEPSKETVAGREVKTLERLGKRIVFGLTGDFFVVIHLMIAGRFKWLERGAKLPGKVGLAALDFENGSLILTEAGSKRRASIHLLQGRDAVDKLDPGGIEPFEMSFDAFAQQLANVRHTLKRTLTDPRIFSGIGNAYSDEILHRAKLSPFLLTTHLDDDEKRRLYEAIRGVLNEWMTNLIRETGEKFPEKVTAFRPEMAVHGKHGKPCPVCGAPVQRIAYADNETNYCATCQTGGKLLADRALSRLLKEDWPRTLEELEELYRK